MIWISSYLILKKLMMIIDCLFKMSLKRFNIWMTSKQKILTRDLMNLFRNYKKGGISSKMNFQKNLLLRRIKYPVKIRFLTRIKRKYKVLKLFIQNCRNSSKKIQMLKFWQELMIFLNLSADRLKLLKKLQNVRTLIKMILVLIHLLNL